MPSWMKDKEVIEGEIEEPSPGNSAEASMPEEATGPSEPSPEATEEPKSDGVEELAEKSIENDDDDQTPPPPPSGGPAGETDAPSSEKGPTPDWLKGV